MSRQRKEMHLSRGHFETHFAAIDIGSHTTRMIVVCEDGNELIPLRAERRFTRLAQDFQKSREITLEAQERNIAALKEYRAILLEMGVERNASGATGVVRRAANCAAVLRRIALETGFSTAILSEEKEAFLSAKAMLSVLPGKNGDFLLFDVGGGSTEILLAISDREQPLWSASLPFGAATLTDSFLRRDPPGAGAVEDAATFVAKEIASAKEQMRAILSKIGIMQISGRFCLAGTAGTVTTLAAMYLEMTRYEPYRVNGLVLTEQWLLEVINKLAAIPLIERRRIPGLEHGREDIILGGAIIVAAILACFTQTSLTVTDAGLLEGLLIDFVEREKGLHGGLRTSLTWRLQRG
jgi:exopolyphosphatase / guanosine-5'-triphosphate,3'-diphosphate pyrophosphatase